MGSDLTCEERALIDAAVEAGRVRRVPTGLTSYVLRWDETQKRLATHRVSIDGRESGPMGRDDWLEHNKAALHRRHRSPARMEQMRAAMEKGKAVQAAQYAAMREERIARLREGIAAGIVGRVALAEYVGCNVDTLDKDARLAGIEVPKLEQNQERAGRVARLREGIAKGLSTRPALAEYVGVNVKTITRYCAEEGIEAPYQAARAAK